MIPTTDLQRGRHVVFQARCGAQAPLLLPTGAVAWEAQGALESLPSARPLASVTHAWAAYAEPSRNSPQAASVPSFLPSPTPFGEGPTHPHAARTLGGWGARRFLPGLRLQLSPISNQVDGRVLRTGGPASFGTCVGPGGHPSHNVIPSLAAMMFLRHSPRSCSCDAAPQTHRRERKKRGGTGAFEQERERERDGGVCAARVAQRGDCLQVARPPGQLQRRQGPAERAQDQPG